jgi:hypothetical protein
MWLFHFFLRRHRVSDLVYLNVDAGGEGGEEEEKEEEKKEDEKAYTVIGNSRPNSKNTFSMYSKCPLDSRSMHWRSLILHGLLVRYIRLTVLTLFSQPLLSLRQFRSIQMTTRGTTSWCGDGV